MEDNQQIITPQEREERPQVGFPQSNAKKTKKFPKAIIAILGLIIILGGGGYLVFSSANEEDPKATSTPSTLSSLITPQPQTPSATQTPSSTSTPKPVDRTAISIEVLNGTGTPGDAGVAKTALEKLGYKEIETGNASSQTETTTTITFDKSLSETVVDEITKELEKTFSTVTTKKSTLSGDIKVRVVTGTKKAGSATAKPQATKSPTPKASSTPTASPSSTKSPTPTSSPNTQ